MSIARESDATWVIPTEDEWYKPAFHKNDGVTGNYWKFATSSDTQHDNRPADPPDFIVVDPDPGDSATTRWHDDSSWTVGGNLCGGWCGLWRTEVGEWENSESPYGTFDQAGNVWEWFESPLPAGGNGNRVLRGGSYDHWEFETRYQLVDGITPDFEHQVAGFRLANLVVEPSTDDADFDVDGDIDGADFLIWQRGFGTTGTPGTLLGQGDADGNGTVDGLDLGVWGNQFGTTSIVSATAAVPEPSSLVLLLAVGVLLAARRQR